MFVKPANILDSAILNMIAKPLQGSVLYNKIKTSDQLSQKHEMDFLNAFHQTPAVIHVYLWLRSVFDVKLWKVTTYHIEQDIQDKQDKHPVMDAFCHLRFQEYHSKVVSY